MSQYNTAIGLSLLAPISQNKGVFSRRKRLNWYVILFQIRLLNWIRQNFTMLICIILCNTLRIRNTNLEEEWQYKTHLSATLSPIGKKNITKSCRIHPQENEQFSLDLSGRILHLERQEKGALKRVYSTWWLVTSEAQAWRVKATFQYWTCGCYKILLHKNKKALCRNMWAYEAAKGPEEICFQC